MKTSLNLLVAVTLVATLGGCERYADDYKDYLDGKEIVYPGLARNVRYQAGNLRTILVWNPSPDPNIDHYTVRWNNGAGSVTVAASTHNPADSITVSIPDLDEYVYSFTITAFDREGNASIGQEANNVRVYGPTYQSVLLNRGYDGSRPYEVLEGGAVRLFFNAPDTLNTGTLIHYRNTADEAKTAVLAPGASDIVIPDFRFGTEITYRSGYVPEPNAADTFYALSAQSFPPIQYIVLADRSLFQPLYLPGDAPDAWGWVLPYSWDGNAGEPGFHTPDLAFPISFSMDLGVAASLTSLKVWQRYSGLYNYGNPKVFEVWGSSDPAPDGSWDSWIKLGTFANVKPSGLPVGQNSAADEAMAAAGDAYMFEEPTSPVRYLRFRIVETWGSTSYFHIVQLAVYRLGE